MDPARAQHWPPFGLVVRTPTVELRGIDDDTAFELLALAAGGVHPPDFMPFTVPWTDDPDGVREQNSLRHYWRARVDLSPEKWDLGLAVRVDGDLVGVQGLHAEEFARRRVASTGSWLAQRHQGRGIGKEMRAAVAHLAFEGLGAMRCESAAFEDNAASLGVSRSLGYVENGDEIQLRRGEPARIVRLALSREAWEARRRDDIAIEGLEPLRAFLGLTLDPAPAPAAGPT